MSVGFLNKFYTKIAGAITAAAVIITIPDTEYRSLLELDQDYVHALLRDKTNREVVIIDVAASTYSGLSVLRGQESTVARAWPRGSTIAQVVTADNYEDFLQVGSERSVGYDPTGVLSPQHLGEKVLQLTDNDASTRWWIAKNATDKKWLPLTDTVDPGGGGGGVDPGGGGGGGGGDTAILNVVWTMEDWNVGETVVYDDSFYGYDGEQGSYGGTGLVSKDTSIYKVGTASARLDLNGDCLTYLLGGSTFSCSHAYTGLDTTLAGWIYLPASIAPGNAMFMDLFLGACPFVGGDPSIGHSIGVWYVESAWQIIVYYSSAINTVFAVAGSYTIGGWTHLACVLDASATNVYVYENGSLIHTLDVSTEYQDMTGFAFLGVSNVSNSIIPAGTDLYCYFDDVRAYNYALTVAEINALPGF